MASIFFKILRICDSQFICNYVINEAFFLKFLLDFWTLYQILNIFKEKMIVIANVFPKLKTVKIFGRKLYKEPRFRTGFGSQHVEASQILVKSPWDNFDHVTLSFSEKLIWKMSPLVLCEILGVFVNKLTSDGKYPIEYCANLQLPIPMQLSEKQKTFSRFFIPFLESTSNFKHLKKKMIVIANVFLKLQTVKMLVRQLSKKRHFRTRFGSQHVKAFQILWKSPWERFYHVFHHSQETWLGKCLP